MKRLQSKKPNQEVVLERLLYLFAYYTLEMAYPNTKSIMTVPAPILPPSHYPPPFSPLTHISHATHRGSGSSQTN